MDKGAWWAMVHKGHRESDMTEQLKKTPQPTCPAPLVKFALGEDQSPLRDLTPIPWSDHLAGQESIIRS